MKRPIKKMYLSAFALSFLLLCVGYHAFAQDREGYDYSREFTWGISKNTNSGLIAGGAIKFSRSLGNDKFQTFGLEIVNVKHPKEFRYHSFSGNTFIWGKQNYLLSIRPQYGREWLIFKKAPQQGVQISAILAGGPTLGLLAPYFIKWDEQGGAGVVEEPFDPIKHRDLAEVAGSGSFLRGLGRSNLRIGANIKAALAFEFGTFKNDVTGFEAGFQLEAFPKEVVIVPAAENKSLFPSAFIMLFYGRRK